MSSSMDKLAKELYTTMLESNNKTTSSYDTQATVLSTDGDFLWVHIPGGVDRTPVRRTVDAAPGDQIMVRVSDHSSWAIGNATSPPTDDTLAKQAIESSAVANKTVKDVSEMVINNSRIVDSELENVKARNVELSNVVASNARITNSFIDGLTAVDSDIRDSKIEGFTVIDGVVQGLQADRAEILGNISANSADIITLGAKTAYIDQLTTANITAQNLIADHAEIENLDNNYAHITNGVIDNATIGYADVDGLHANYAHVTNGTIDNAKIGYADVNGLNANYAHITNGAIDNATIGYADVNDLNAHYAGIDLANVNNAWIQNGVIKNGAIADAQIIGISANKLTAGTIDASNITVTNLNASNITTGTINGQRIGTGSLSLDKLSENVYTETEVDSMLETMQEEIDGAIETYTGSVVPTLQNYPAVNWYKPSQTPPIDDRQKHIGDVYYVINAGAQADGYCYRYAYDNTTSTYGWVLIKDSDVTATLQRLIDAEGDISNLESFQSTTSSWITQTDNEISSIKSRTTTVETGLNDKVSTSTFNTLSQTVNENSSSITSLSTTVSSKADSSTVTTISNTVNNISQTATANSSKISNITTVLGTNADGTTKANDIVHRMSATEQDLSGFKTTVSSTYATKSSIPTKTSDLTNDSGYATESYADGKASDAVTEANNDTDLKLASYSTTLQMNTAIQQSANQITSTVSQTYATKSSVPTKVADLEDAEDYATTEYTGDQISLAVSETQQVLQTQIDQTNNNILLKAIEQTINHNYTYTSAAGTTFDENIIYYIQNEDDLWVPVEEPVAADIATYYTRSENPNMDPAEAVASMLIDSFISIAPNEIILSADKVSFPGYNSFSEVSGAIESKVDISYIYKIVETPTVDDISTYYELIDDEYVVTSDQIIDSTKTYYVKEIFDAAQELTSKVDSVNGDSSMTWQNGVLAIEAKSNNSSYATVIGGDGIEFVYGYTDLDTPGYVKTRDQNIKQGKNYYIKSDDPNDPYTRVTNPDVNDIDTYYEYSFIYKENTVASINQDVLDINKTVVLDEMQVGRKKWAWHFDDSDDSIYLKWIGD